MHLYSISHLDSISHLYRPSIYHIAISTAGPISHVPTISTESGESEVAGLDGEVAGGVEGRPVGALLGGRDGEAGVVGVALVVGGGVRLRDGVREGAAAALLHLYPQLVYQVVLPVALLLQRPRVRLQRQLLVPHPAVVLLHTLALRRIREEVVEEGGAASEHRGGVALGSFEWIWDVPRPVLLCHFGEGCLLRVEGREVSDNLGLLRDEVELIGLEPAQHSISGEEILLLGAGPPALGREAEPACEFLRLEVVEVGDAAVAEGVPGGRSHDYKQLMEGEGQGRAGQGRGAAWSEERQKEQARKQIDLRENVEHYAASLIQRLSEGGGRGSEKASQQLSKKVNHEIESNICSICLELMIPPLRNPIILFPCGHNICKDCLFERPPQGHLKKNLKLKLEKCSLCRQKIESYAVNQSLMALICAYSNNKHLIEQEQRRLDDHAGQEEEGGQNGEQLKARCGILERELAALSGEQEQCSRSRAVLGEVIETLKREKKKVEREMEKVEDEGRLINKCLSQKVQEMEFLESRLREAQDRSRVLDKALQPLLKEKERQEFLLMQKLLNKR